jgi:hypothetical protein
MHFPHFRGLSGSRRAPFCAKHNSSLARRRCRFPHTRLAEELADDDVVEMANLTTAQTGVPGTIFISTAMGGTGRG